MINRRVSTPVQSASPDRENTEEWRDAFVARRAPRIPQIVWLGIVLGLFCLRYPLATFSGVPPLVISLGVVALLPLACRKRGGTLACMTFVVGVVAFESLRSVVDQLGFPVHAGDLRQLDEWIGFGALPSSVLQRFFHSPSGFGVIGYVTVAVHGSYFVVPYVALAAVWADRPPATERLTFPLLSTLGAGLVLNAVLPSMPPWLGSTYLGTSDVDRVLYLVLQSFVGSARAVGESLGDPNPTACLPSLHFAVTFVLFLCARERGRLLGYVGASYCLAMAFSLVYLGEHYVVDCILGSVVAYAAWQASSLRAGRESRLGHGPRLS